MGAVNSTDVEPTTGVTNQLSTDGTVNPVKLEQNIPFSPVILPFGSNNQYITASMSNTPRGNTVSYHTNGCHCKRSACLKKYCECFQVSSDKLMKN